MRPHSFQRTDYLIWPILFAKTICPSAIHTFHVFVDWMDHTQILCHVHNIKFFLFKDIIKNRPIRILLFKGIFLYCYHMLSVSGIVYFNIVNMMIMYPLIILLIRQTYLLLFSVFIKVKTLDEDKYFIIFSKGKKNCILSDSENWKIIVFNFKTLPKHYITSEAYSTSRNYQAIYFWIFQNSYNHFCYKLLLFQY